MIIRRVVVAQLMQRRILITYTTHTEQDEMANFKMVNAQIKSKFPSLDIEVVRGDGYVYFDGKDGFDLIESIWSSPVSTSTEEMTRMAIENIQESQC